MNRHDVPSRPDEPEAKKLQWWGPVLAAMAAIGLGLLMFDRLSAVEPGPPVEAGDEAAPATWQRVGPDRFSALVDDTAVVINVHVPDEGSIPGSDLSIAFDEINDSTELPADRETTLAIYCRSGTMSTIAAAALTDAGYLNVIELGGGMNAWLESGRRLDP